MEPTSNFAWNVAATEFSWNLNVPEFVPQGTSQLADKKAGKKKHEEKKVVSPKETLAVCIFGPSGSGKSTVVNALAGSAKSFTMQHGRVLNKDFKSRRYAIFDCNSVLSDQLPVLALTDFVVLMIKIDNIDENYVREASVILKNFVSTRVVVALTQMDLVSWNDTTYFNALNTIRRILDRNGLNDNIFVPVSRESNVGQKVLKDVAPWYNGKSLILTLETLKGVQGKSDKGVKSPAFQILGEAPGSFLVKLYSGSLSRNSKLTLLPFDQKTEILNLTDSCGHKIDNAKNGEVVKITLRVPEEQAGARGQVLCEMHERCVTAKEFRAEVTFFNLTEGVVNPGFHCFVQLHSAFEPAEVSEILSVLDLETKAKQKISTARNDQRANVVMKVPSSVCAENWSRGWEALSKFSLWQESRVVGVGKILELHTRVEEIASQMGLF